MAYNPKKHHRRSIRLKNYDYGQEGSYFITICTEHRLHLFGEIRNGIMRLNEFGVIAYEEWLKTPIIRPNVSLGAMIVMPNHMHGILHIDQQVKKNSSIGKFQSPTQTVGAVVRGFKGATTSRVKEVVRGLEVGAVRAVWANCNSPLPSLLGLAEQVDLEESIWLGGYYEHIIRDDRAYQNISNYIDNNPIRWKKDKFFT